MIVKNPFKKRLGVCIVFSLLAFPLPLQAKTYETNHYKFSIGWRSQYSDEELKTISDLIDRLDDIWVEVNRLCENNLPPTLKLEVKREGTTSRALRKQKKVLINSIKIRNGLRDCLTIVAHESTHIGYYTISRGKILNPINKFLDEGIAMYAMYFFEPNRKQKRELAFRIAQNDLQNGKASLPYLRDWKTNVDDKLSKFSKNWRNKNPDKSPTLDDELKVGVNSYYTSSVFVEYLIDTYGLPKFVNAIRNLGNGESQSNAFKTAMGKNIEEIFAHWHTVLKQSD